MVLRSLKYGGMPITRIQLEAAIQASGGAAQPDDQIDGLLNKLALLETTQRYSRLLTGIRKANDKWNFLASVLEATFAFQFESTGKALSYEVKQLPSHGSSIDFMLTFGRRQVAYFELRLLQQDAGTKANVDAQLASTGGYMVAMNGEDVRSTYFRLQSVILEKVQKRDGTPVKFLSTEPDVFNIVVVCVSDILQDTVDAIDCLQVMYGDPEVDQLHHLGVFGLFQETKPEYPPYIQAAANKFAHFRATVHAVQFLFRAQAADTVDYELQQITVWNRKLTSENESLPHRREISKAIPHRSI